MTSIIGTQQTPKLDDTLLRLLWLESQKKSSTHLSQKRAFIGVDNYKVQKQSKHWARLDSRAEIILWFLQRLTSITLAYLVLAFSQRREIASWVALVGPARTLPFLPWASCGTQRNRALWLDRLHLIETKQGHLGKRQFQTGEDSGGGGGKMSTILCI